VRLVGFILRIYHDARSSECQVPNEILIINPASWRLAVCSVACHAA